MKQNKRNVCPDPNPRTDGYSSAEKVFKQKKLANMYLPNVYDGYPILANQGSVLSLAFKTNKSKTNLQEGSRPNYLKSRQIASRIRVKLCIYLRYRTLQQSVVK